MKCQACDEHIDPRFTHALTANACPFCGEAIMSAELQEALNTLRETVEAAVAADFLPQIFDWLRSNCNLISTDGEEYLAIQAELSQTKQELKETKERYTKPIPRSGRPHQSSEIQMGVDEEGNSVQLSGEAIQDQGQTDVFMDRAASMNPAIKQSLNRSAQLRQMVSQSRKLGGPVSGPSYPVLTPAMMAAATPEQIEAMEAQLDGGLPGMPNAAPYDDGSEPLDPVAEALANMGQRGSGAAQGGYNAKDMAMLRKMQGKATDASRELDRGGSVGLIRR